ncbi:hypothetical protein BDF14DRAFT_1879200 [Spinellus fusiger]|nr:hypothetical protein BDF14DRAFT_1879200 [Spinellus fusiger]
MSNQQDLRGNTINEQAFGQTSFQNVDSEQLLQPLYERLLSLSFTESAMAIEHCRELCAEFGFTVKQEASTHKNIYVYCSREGVPDSLRKRISTPQRKRPSKRCDCRWRVVLYEREGRWEFRKSQNPEAAKHNHEFMRPEDIERNWPRDVIDMICELARQRLTTQEIRNEVKSRFPNINWNERRFYNRLSEERQKIKRREAVSRARSLTSWWTKICIVSAGNEELSRFVEAEAIRLLMAVCESAHIDPDTLQSPNLEEGTDSNEDIARADTSSDSLDLEKGKARLDTRNENVTFGRSMSLQNQSIDGFIEQLPSDIDEAMGMQNSDTILYPKIPKQEVNISGSKVPEVPKGYTTIVVPRHTYYVKLHTQRAMNDIQVNRTSRRQGSGSVVEDTAIESSTTGSKRNTKRRRESHGQIDDPISGTSDSLHTLQHQHSFLAGTSQHRGHTVPLAPLQQHHSLQQAPSSEPSFVYHTSYENQGLPMATPMQNYVHPSFYHHTMSNHGTNSFTPNSELGFQFDPPNTSSMMRHHLHSGVSPNTNTNQENNIHSAFQTHSMEHGKPLPPVLNSSSMTHHQHNQNVAQPLTIIHHQPQ